MASIAAEESLAQVNVLQVGTGAAKRERAKKMINGWKRDARKPAKRPLSREAWLANLARTGIGLRIVNDR